MTLKGGTVTLAQLLFQVARTRAFTLAIRRDRRFIDGRDSLTELFDISRFNHAYRVGRLEPGRLRGFNHIGAGYAGFLG